MCVCVCVCAYEALQNDGGNGMRIGGKRIKKGRKIDQIERYVDNHESVHLIQFHTHAHTQPLKHTKNNK